MLESPDRIPLLPTYNKKSVKSKLKVVLFLLVFIILTAAISNYSAYQSVIKNLARDTIQRSQLANRLISINSKSDNTQVTKARPTKNIPMSSYAQFSLFKWRSSLVDFANLHLEYNLSMPLNIDVCRKIKYFVFVPTRPSAFETRAAARSSWAKEPPAEFLVRFVVGQPNITTEGADIYNKLYDEGQNFNDIIFYDAKDHYRMLHVKVKRAILFGYGCLVEYIVNCLSALRRMEDSTTEFPNTKTFKLADYQCQCLLSQIAGSWFKIEVYAVLTWQQLYCSDAQFVFRADADTIIDLDRLQYWMKNGLVPEKSENSSLIFGYLDLVAKIKRDPNHKQYVSYEDYPSDILPPYVWGFFYGLSQQAVKSVLNVSHTVKGFPLDDLLYTGVLAKKAGVKVVSAANYLELKFGDIGDDKRDCDSKKKMPFAIAYCCVDNPKKITDSFRILKNITCKSLVAVKHPRKP